ncbi:MAG: phosphatase PAP2 family protein [Candidatus Berkelbacteria bacterium]|nr:phosphatase PAP2 family protein [Candidatus Berkelbacteria bacterium]
MNNILNKIRYDDYEIYRILHGAISGRPWLNETYLFFAKYGIVFFFLSFIYLILQKRINAFICAFMAMGIAAIVDFVIVIFWKRPRPFISHSSEILTPITQGLRVYSVSFPSVHTYIAFAIATSVFLYGHKKLGTALFVLATCVAIGRVGAGLHYPSDVIAGAFLGIASGIMAYLITHAKESKWE